MAKLEFVTAYGKKNKVTVDPVGESLTQQHFKDEADIMNIIKKHDRTGLIDYVTRATARYGDYSEINEYRESLDVVNQANSSFMGLPAHIRQMFDNDAGKFFEFATNPANKQEMVNLGLAVAPRPKSMDNPPAAKQALAAEDVNIESS